MFRLMTIALAAVLVLGVAGGAWAQNDGGPLAVADEVGDVTINLGLSAATSRYLSKWLCKDPTAGGKLVQVAVTDCCNPGDIWRATVSVGGGNKVGHTANITSFAVPASPALAPGVMSSLSSGVITRTAQVFFSMGNSAPGGLGAGATGHVFYSAGAPACVLKKVLN